MQTSALSRTIHRIVGRIGAASRLDVRGELVVESGTSETLTRIKELTVSDGLKPELAGKESVRLKVRRELQELKRRLLDWGGSKADSGERSVKT